MEESYARCVHRETQEEKERNGVMYKTKEAKVGEEKDLAF